MSMHAWRCGLVVALSLGLGACAPAAEPPEPTTWSRTWYVDPAQGSDEADGLSPATPLRTLERFQVAGPRHLAVQADSRILLKRGTALRPGATLQLHGHDRGWVLLGAYGEPGAPRPVLLGSVPVGAADWSAPGADGVRTLDWSLYLDGGGGRSRDGVEQGPGNLWFFASDRPDARLTGWGFRKKDDVGPGSAEGDWHYAAATRTVRLKWSGPPPAFTEAAVNRLMLDASGQRHVIVEELDLRYGGNCGLWGHALRHLRVRGVDVSFLGGGTKSRVNGQDQYVRLGNGFEFLGGVEDVLVEGCRAHQIYDTGMDPQVVGDGTASLKGLVFRDNLISFTGLAGVELWWRPGVGAGSVLEDVTVERNTLLSVGRGWGYEQHDHPGQAQVGAAFLTLASRGEARGVVVRRNVVVGPRVAVLSEFSDPDTRAFFRALGFDENLWDLRGGLGAVLFKGAGGQVVPDLTGSSVYADLAAWQASDELPGQEVHSVAADAQFDDPAAPLTQDGAWLRALAADDPQRPTRLGPFALRGDYRRSRATVGVGWGANRPP